MREGGIGSPTLAPSLGPGAAPPLPRRGPFLRDLTPPCGDPSRLTLNAKGTLLAAVDDSGEAVVVDLEGGKLQKRLQGAYENICSSVQFRLRRPWEVITFGGRRCLSLSERSPAASGSWVF